MRFHCISGLPRSGSTLLAALLRQNPRVHAAISSPVMGIVCSLLNAMSPKSEWYNSFDETKRRNVLRNAIFGYYCDVGKPLIFDTNRVWTGKMSLLDKLFPDARVICCVRSIPAILESVERLVEKNPEQPSRIFGFDPEMGMYERVEKMMGERGLVGLPWRMLKQAYYGEHAKKLLLIEYNSLVTRPHEVLHHIYEFLDEDSYSQHDTENVSYSEPEFDRVIGLSGLHDVTGPIAPRDHASILPPDVYLKCRGMEFWREKNENFSVDKSASPM